MMTLENDLNEKRLPLERRKVFSEYLSRIRRKKRDKKRIDGLRRIKQLAAQTGVDLRKVM